MRVTVSTIITGGRSCQCIQDGIEERLTGFEEDYSDEAESDDGTSKRDFASRGAGHQYERHYLHEREPPTHSVPAEQIVLSYTVS